MPTVVHFVGAEEPVTLEDEYDRVNLQLRTEGKAGEFVRVIGENCMRVTVYKSGIAYIEDASKAKSEPGGRGSLTRAVRIRATHRPRARPVSRRRS